MHTYIQMSYFVAKMRHEFMVSNYLMLSVTNVVSKMPIQRINILPGIQIKNNWSRNIITHLCLYKSYVITNTFIISASLSYQNVRCLYLNVSTYLNIDNNLAINIIIIVGMKNYIPNFYEVLQKECRQNAKTDFLKRCTYKNSYMPRCCINRS